MYTNEEINWFSKADFNKYAGKYVAIIEKRFDKFEVIFRQHEKKVVFRGNDQ